MSKIPADLKSKRDKHIRDICPFSLGQLDHQNHCAHFVSHVMGYEFSGPTCKNFTWEDKSKIGKGATLRVDDLFNRITQLDYLDKRPASILEYLVFVTPSSNVKKQALNSRWAPIPKSTLACAMGN